MVSKLGDVDWGTFAAKWQPPTLTPEQEAEAAARELERAALEAQARRDRCAESLRRAGVSLRDETRALLLDGALTATEARAAADEWWAERKQPWLVLSGRAGSGKSVAAARLVSERGGVWMRSDDVVRVFSGMFGDPLEKQERAKETHLLVVDDLGAEVDHVRMLPALLELLDTRASAKNRPTICTTNLTKREFAERYANERLNSRMRELVRWVSIASGDMRGKCG